MWYDRAFCGVVKGEVGFKIIDDRAIPSAHPVVEYFDGVRGSDCSTERLGSKRLLLFQQSEKARFIRGVGSWCTTFVPWPFPCSSVDAGLVPGDFLAVSEMSGSVLCFFVEEAYHQPQT